MIKILKELTEELAQAEIQFCHWKGNYSLNSVLVGAKDFELFVERKSLSKVFSILNQLGFKRANSQHGYQPKGVFHYYGLNTDPGILVHIHLYCHLITGEKYCPNHQIPLDNLLLKNIGSTQPVRQTSKGIESVVFALRIAVQMGSVFDLFYLRRKREHLNAEWEWLRKDQSSIELKELMTQYPLLRDNTTLFLKWISLLDQPGSLFKKQVTAYRVRQTLKPYRIKSRGGQFYRYILLSLGAFWRRISFQSNGKILDSGGAVIAIVGPDATGKSTLVKLTRDWLDEAFTTKSIHAGKPPSAWITLPFNFFSYFLRRSSTNYKMAKLEGHIPSETSEKGSVQTAQKEISSTQILYAVRSVATAWDRRRLLLRAKKQARNGAFIISDRYPSDTVGMMDSPRLQFRESAVTWRERIYNRLVTWEKQLYGQIPLPDVVIQLSVSIETALKRNQNRIKSDKEGSDYIESRHRKSVAWDRVGVESIQHISTEGTLDETIALVRKAVWESL